MAILGRCPRCGHLLTDDKPVCPRCGVSGGPSVSDAGTSQRYRWATALMAVLVVVLLGVAIYGMARRSQRSSSGPDGGRVTTANPSAQKPSSAGQQRSAYAPRGSQTAAAPDGRPSKGMPSSRGPEASGGPTQGAGGSPGVTTPSGNRSAEVKIVTKPDPEKPGNLGIGLTLVVNGRPVSYLRRSANVPKAHVVIKSPDGQILHQDTAGMDKFTFG